LETVGQTGRCCMAPGASAIDSRLGSIEKRSGPRYMSSVDILLARHANDDDDAVGGAAVVCRGHFSLSLCTGKSEKKQRYQRNKNSCSTTVK